jgi:dihydrolipoyl dehydrogenase
VDMTDLVVIGAGPGGYLAAIRAAQLGLAVVLVDENAALGGTCLRVGCIPSKALLESSHLFAQSKSDLSQHGLTIGQIELDLAALIRRKDGVVAQLAGGIDKLMKKHKVKVLQGRGSLIDKNKVAVKGPDGTTEIGAKYILLATGSLPIELPSLPFDGKTIVSSDSALSFDRVPGHLVVVGAGAIGLELGQVWRRLGAKVTIVELLPQIAPFADKLAARMLLRALKGQDIEFFVGSRVISAEVTGSTVKVIIEDEKKATSELTCDCVLSAVGRKPNTSGLGLAKLGIALDERGRVAVDDKLQTSLAGVYAIGDLVRGPMLAHKAEEEGVAVAQTLAGHPTAVNYEVIPGVVYTQPELGMLGKTEEQCKAEGLDYKSGRFYFAANGRAVAAGQTDGLVKILADKKDNRLLGVHIVGPCASEIIAEAVLVMQHNLSAADLADTIHAHPTFSEAVKEAAKAIDSP